MRKPQNGKTGKNDNSLTISKEKTPRQTKRASNRWKSRVTMENLECINDDPHFHQAYGLRGTWKLVPKDSCDVYRDRKRQEKDNDNSKTSKERSSMGRRGRSRKVQPSTDTSITDDESSRYCREKPVRAQKRAKKTSTRRSYRKRAKRSSSYETASSRTSNSEWSMSSYSSNTER